ncbi:PD-(D/E)XK nuclease-like domain-containing protein [Salmonella enterica subsp. enterica serovar Newport]|nr:exonuclease VIII [Salmonella enterica subsp. enterica serovar Newport]EBO4048535.1 exonuclease VIII [Salmonella enterica]EEH9027634.1 exonuclease VIII [Salmonella enterica subsp. enterica serovar Newport]ELC2954703.1 PD-(D/E)XK nuclease-like domain-containing protein [Salmonella enterica]
MSENKEDFALHCLVKNEEARKRLGIKAGFFWTTAKKLSVAVSRCIAAMDDKGFDEDDFKKPVRVNVPVVNDLPPEGVFDTEFCNRYEKGGEDGKTMMLIPGAAPADQFHEQMAADDDASSDTASTDTPADSDDTAGDPLPAYAYNVNGELMSEVEKDMSQPVSGLALPLRYLAQCDTDSVQHQITPERLRELHLLEMDPDNRTGSILLALQNRKAQLEKLDTKNLHSLASYIGKVFPKGKQPQLNDLINFIDAVVSTEHIDRGLLVKEWQKGNRVSSINRTPSGANAGGGILTDRGEGFVHDKASLARDVAMGVLARSMDLDIYNLHQAHAKRVDEIVADNKPPFDVFCKAFLNMPGGMDYSRAIVVASVKEAPIGIEAIPARVTEYLNRVLTETDHASPDPLIFDIACGRTSQPMPMTGSANDDEEKPQPTGELADEPATPEAVEQDTTEHHPDPQPLENEPPVSQTEAGYQKIRAELHEARKNIPPKNPVDVGKQLAAARGEYVEGISDPNDPKWVRDDYSASNQGEKTENPLPPTDAVTATAMEGEFIPTQEWPEYFEPGRYEGVPNDVYHSANGISSTMVKDARISLMYYHGRHVTRVIPRQDSQAFILGRIIHSFVLEPEKFTTEYAVPAEMPKSVVSTTSDMVALIKEYNATLPALMTPDELKAWIERYNSSLIPPLSLSGSAEEIANLYMSLPGEFQRIPDDVKATATAMKSCIKEYNISLPPMLKTSGTRDQLLDQIATVRPEFAEQERAKFIPYNVSGTKEQLTEIVRTIRPDVVLADDWHRQQEEASQGRTMISLEMSGLVKNINDALQADEDAARLLNHPERKSEVSYFGFDEETGLEVRVRPDIEIRLPSPLDSICADLKTVSMGYVPQDRLKARLHREIIERGYHISAAMYCDVAALDTFAWIFVNKDPGYHWVAVVWAPAEMLELGRQEYRRLLRQINEATFSGYWPAPVAGQYVDELNDYDISRLDALNKMSQEDFA